MKRRRPPGLNPKCYGPTQRWQLDSLEDGYLEKCPPEVQAWMARFLDAHYHGRRNGAQKLTQQRASDRARKANAGDALTRAVVIGGLRPVVDGAEGPHTDEALKQPKGGKNKATRLVWDERLQIEEEKRIEELDAAEADAIRDRIRAFRRR